LLSVYYLNFLLRFICLDYGGNAAQFYHEDQGKPRQDTNQRTIRNKSASLPTDSRGQTQDEIEEEEDDQRITHNHENPLSDDHHNDNIFERGEESDDDQTLEDLVAAAQVSLF
jgi:hypothetical protein